MTIRAFIKKFLGISSEGAIAVEMAVIASATALLVPVLVDAATLTKNSMALSEGLRAGALFAQKYPTNSSGITQVIIDSGNLNQSNLTVSTAQTCTCNSSSATCGAACAGTSAAFITVTAVYNVPIIFSVPGYSSPRTFTKSLTVRTS